MKAAGNDSSFPSSRFLVIVPFLCLICIAAATNKDKSQSSRINVTTKSAAARTLFNDGWSKVQTFRFAEALESWRKATQADPQLALAHVLIAYHTTNPAEQVSEQEKALESKAYAGREEELIVDWLANTVQSHWIPAIQAMNEALQQYPNDGGLAWLAGTWLEIQQQPSRAIPLFEKSIHIDPTFPEPWNELAYCNARIRRFDKAFEAMKRYTALLPHESNPQDSFAEISRMAGRFEDALIHYRASLKLDPKFTMSQMGIADTYALIGDEPRARTEYAVALQKAPTNIEATLWSLQSAITYVREGNTRGADEAFQAVARQAHENDLGNTEARAYRMMALYQKDYATAISLLDKAEAALHEDHKISNSLLEQEYAFILQARVTLAVQNGNTETASAALDQLEQVAGRSNDGFIQHAYNGAAGTMLLAQKNPEKAVYHLEQDPRNPFSMLLLVQAYEQAGAKDDAERMRQALAGFNEPTIEQALVVPQFRKQKGAATVSSLPKL
jgi:tetratricopeptide (TPR) repeat protein